MAPRGKPKEPRLAEGETRKRDSKKGFILSKGDICRDEEPSGGQMITLIPFFGEMSTGQTHIEVRVHRALSVMLTSHGRTRCSRRRAVEGRSGEGCPERLHASNQ